MKVKPDPTSDQDSLEDFELDGVGSSIEEMYGEKEMRWYQVAARNQTIEAVREGVMRILIVLPTGAGKTITIAASTGAADMRSAIEVAYRARTGDKTFKIGDRPLRVLFVAHTHRLLTQAERTFMEDSNVELIPQSMMSDIPQDVIDRGWDICVLDEAHHEACASFQYQLEKLGDFPIIGLTATKDRADGCVIKFDVIIEPISREQAVAEGYLAPTKIHSFVDVPSKTKVQVLGRILEDYAHQMGQTMVFLKTKAEVAEIVQIIESLGYKAVGVLSQNERQLDALLDAFGRGEFQFIVNCKKINEGVDVKGCTDVLLGRQFGSYPQLNQVIGRAARPDSECNVWELINPLSARNLDTTVVVGTPEFHRLVSWESNNWVEREFDYVSHRSNSQMGITPGAGRGLF